MIKLSYSIIIPIYNASTYLAFSLESLLSQPFQDFELILVDDGSTDESASICDAYAAKDDRIKVLLVLGRWDWRRRRGSISSMWMPMTK